MSYFSGDVSLVPPQGRLVVRKRNSYGWKRRGCGFRVRRRIQLFWVRGRQKPLDALDLVEVESEPEERRGERPAQLLQNGYTRRNKDATIVPPPDSGTPLDDATLPSDGSSKIDSKVHVSSPIFSASNIDLDPNPVASKTADLNPQAGGQDRRYPLCDRKEPDRVAFLQIIF